MVVPLSSTATRAGAATACAPVLGAGEPSTNGRARARRRLTWADWPKSPCVRRAIRQFGPSHPTRLGPELLAGSPVTALAIWVRVPASPFVRFGQLPSASPVVLYFSLVAERLS